MSETLEQKRKHMEMMQLELNIQKLEIRLLELDEEKILIQEKIQKQSESLQKLKAGPIKEDE